VAHVLTAGGVLAPGSENPGFVFGVGVGKQPVTTGVMTRASPNQPPKRECLLERPDQTREASEGIFQQGTTGVNAPELGILRSLVSARGFSDFLAQRGLTFRV